MNELPSDLGFARATLMRWINKAASTDPRIGKVQRAIDLINSLERSDVVTIAGLEIDV